MRTFLVWVGNSEEEVEMPDDASDLDCNAQCEAVLEIMLGNLDSGWNEITEDLKHEDQLIVREGQTVHIKESK